MEQNKLYYSQNWFIPEELDIINFNKETPLDFLEIGSFEGKSTIYWLETYLKNKNSTITCVDPWTSYSQNSNTLNSYGKENQEWDFTNNYKTFTNNIKISNFIDKVVVKKGYSHDVLPKLITEKKLYDLVFIDGNHTSPSVLTDSINSFYLTKSSGIIIFDDYMWGDINSNNSPKPAIDCFISIFQSYIDVLFTGYRIVIKKK
tara:strand:- start:34 stop:642 length:609 start_codon:yes stop_codon:yes gene_type:complete